MRIVPSSDGFQAKCGVYSRTYYTQPRSLRARLRDAWRAFAG